MGFGQGTDQLGDALLTGGIGAEFGVLAVGVDGLGEGLEVVGEDAEVTPGGGAAGVFADGGREGLPGVAGALLVLLGNAEAVPGFGIFRGELEGGGEASFGKVPLAEAQLGLGKLTPAFGGAGLEGDEGAEGIGGALGVSLFEPEGAEIEMGGGEVVVEAEGVEVGLGGFGGLAIGVMGEAEVVPGLGVGGKELHRGAESAEGVGWFAFFQQTGAVEEGTGSGGGTGGQAQGEAEGPSGAGREAAKVWGRQHSGSG